MIEKIGKMKNLSDSCQQITNYKDLKQKVFSNYNYRVGNWDGQYQPNLQLGHIAILKFPTDEYGNSLIPVDQLKVFYDNVGKVIPSQFSLIMLPDKVDIEFVNIWEDIV